MGRQKNSPGMLRLGRIEKMQSGNLDRLIESLAKFSKKKWIQAEATKIIVKSAREWGTDLIFRKIWENLDLHSTINRLLAKTKISAPVSEAIYAIVLNRISDPLSKRAVNEWINEIYRPSFNNLQLHHFYRALDFLIAHKEIIELEFFEQAVQTPNFRVYSLILLFT